MFHYINHLLLCKGLHSLLILNRAVSPINAYESQPDFLAIIVPQVCQLDFLQAYTLSPYKTIQALLPSAQENDQWYPLGWGTSPQAASAALDKKIHDSLFELSLKEYKQHYEEAMDQMLGRVQRPDNWKIPTYPQLLGFS